MATTGEPVLLNSIYYSVGLPLTALLLTVFFMAIAYRRLIKKAVKNYTSKLPNNPHQLNSLINSLDDVIFEFNEDKICLSAWFNEFEDRVVNPNILVGKRIEDVLSAEKSVKFDEALDYVIANRRPTSLEYISDYGTGRWQLAKLTPVFDRDGNYTYRISVSVADITEQKNYAAVLKEKELLLLEAQTIAKVGNWLFDGATRDIFFSPNLLSILETEAIPADVDKLEYYSGMIHPDDLESASKFLFSVSTSTEKEHEHRLVTAAGNLKYIRIIIGDKELNTDGRLRRIVGIIQDITDIKLSEKAIKKGRNELIEAQTIAKIGNWSWDNTSHKLSWSDEITNIFEVEPGLLAQMGVKRLLLTYVHKNDKFVLQHLFKGATNTPNYTCVFRIVTAGGAVKYLSVIIGKILKNDTGSTRKIIGTLQDITDRKQVEIDFKRTENKYKLVLETIKLAAISLDSDGGIIFCNQHLANLLGYSQKEILGMNWIDSFIPDELKTSVSNMLAHNALPLQYVNPVICRNGEQRIISWQNTTSYDENGLLKETTGIGEDITDQQKATMELISAKELAEKSSKFKSDFLSIMSHEIRTPMNAVIGTTNLLLIDSPRPEQMEYLNILKFSGENLLAIINDILDYNKIEAGKLDLNELKFNIYTLTQKIKQTFASKAAEKNLTLDLTIDEAIPEMVIGDQMRLSQILNNLISNAVKFTTKGKIAITLKAGQLHDDQVNIKFIVEDTGVGIAPENLNMIFDPFMQEPSFNNNNYGGTGLGLAITKRLINLHNSDISVKSQPEKGTTFTFTIAFNLPEKETKNGNTRSAGNPTLSLQGMNVLIVDDNKMNLLIASRFLKKWQANVDEALNGKIAVDMVTGKLYDLIIMDLQMPVMDGFEATELIKKSQPNIPIIALTADAMPETYDKALAAGMSDYLTKPFVPALLFDKVSKYYQAVIKE
ncbi:PAS domain-containing hybrid sensor histidine kinase/response regulator [Mucilaginibacter sp. UR6-11]|uniref:PAS domain-containing hybrid sensor histidine kinase/response regulator n=1 Tax=Mucilaginibacter sp. UR6-11 TaxID=1435644 RepID=UPI001E2A3871|nr:PAS domain-containing hybrid sensor histidine kinase/response regulator [Mucilaginibacter sp. UR6-11]MCC8426665.1 PAS domain S-box protein [Mucilaginibacter sp. UR6-11]